MGRIKKTSICMDRVGLGRWHRLLFFIKFRSCFSPAWLVAGTWQVTILAGLLLSPLFFVKIETKSGTKLVRGKIPLRSLYVALFILLGVICMQATAAGHITMTQFISGIFTCRISGFLISVR